MAKKAENVNLYRVRVEGYGLVRAIEAQNDEQARRKAAAAYGTNVVETKCEIESKKPVFEDSETSGLGKKYASTFGRAVGSFLVDKVNDGVKAYFAASPCMVTSMDKPLPIGNLWEVVTGYDELLQYIQLQRKPYRLV